ncbi:hypothetical protein PVAR5_1554 [Paecilomyces variotii No. 5]|uniref:DH domain-containing protein n=1 Tax=Byssochlamys spectabilis (strain No. 5 / NBRC 109023) TaxID=1356009 RepID=V5HTT3_BYSSN|nr:hypothetical protein PVAR5_1554 [Paecilomyces variotii No. 5]
MNPREDMETPFLTPQSSASHDEPSSSDDKPELTVTPKPESHPFKKWVDSFRLRRQTAARTPLKHVEGWTEEPQRRDSDATLAEFPNLPDTQDQQWEQLSGHSSVLETVKTASISITTQSLITRSRATTQSSTNQSGYPGSPRSHSETRASIDSLRLAPSNSPIDDAAWTRGIKRRQILHEILSTESEYVIGLKSLTEILSSLLPARPTIYHTLQKIRRIHEIFLEQLRIISPKSEEPVDSEIFKLPVRNLHEKWSSMDLGHFRRPHSKSLRTRKLKATVDIRIKAVAADPFEARIVARELDKLSLGFPSYEDFCGNYGLLTEDLAIIRRSHPSWGIYDRGIEALCKAVASKDGQKPEESKAMTLNDLLIKPIQRVCKYPLLLADLLKNTPTSDCPESHDEISQVLEQIRLKVAFINDATGNPLAQDRIQKTVSLQEKLEFPDNCILRDVYRQLGPLILCGVLYVAYETTEGIMGDYMVCILFHGYMVLCRYSDESRKLQLVASIYVLDMRIDLLTNGLHCHSCGFSWKVVFEYKSASFELILSGSSAEEEKQWKMELLKASTTLPKNLPSESLEPRKYSTMSLALEPLPSMGDRLTLLTRRSSVQSLTTTSPRPQQKYVIIKRTNFPSQLDDSNPVYTAELGRSLTSLTMRSAVILSPRRHDRVRLERFIADTYTRDVLPFPGMILRGAEYLLLASPGSLMRRLSFHMPLSRRSSSLTTVTNRSADAVVDVKDEEEWTEKDPEEILTVIEALSTNEGPPSNSADASENLGRSSTIRFTGLRKRAGAPSEIPSRSSSRKSHGEFQYSPKKRWNLSSTLLNALSPSRSRGAKE